MARNFTSTQFEYLKYDGTPPVVAYPFAMAGWVKTTSSADRWLVCIGDLGSSYKFLGGIYLENSDSKWRSYVDDGTPGVAIASTVATDNVWQHVVGVFASTTDRRILMDGGNKGTNATSVSPPSQNRISIGIPSDSTPNGYMNGDIAEVAVWDLSNWPGATDADKANNFETIALSALATGFSPLFWPLGLAGYWPLGGIYDANDGDHDIVGGYNMTDYGAPSVADHPPIIYPTSPQYAIAGAVDLITGTTCWGHSTGVTEDNTLVFTGKWSGTGSITGAGDAEQIELDDTEYMQTDGVVNTGAVTVTLIKNSYGSGDASVVLKYRHGATAAACQAAGWNVYSVPFVSDGYVQVRVEDPV